jgi:hypothetical protein
MDWLLPRLRLIIDGDYLKNTTQANQLAIGFGGTAGQELLG